MSTLWFSGVCDDMLKKVVLWHEAWPQGNPYTEALFLHVDGRQENLTVQREVHVPWTKPEFEHLVRILKAVRPDHPLTADLEKVLPKLHKAKLIQGNQRLLPMRSHHQDVKDILEALIIARDGDKSGLETHISEQKQQGKGLWDVGV